VTTQAQTTESPRTSADEAKVFPPPPRRICDASGEPQLGTYFGGADEIDLSPAARRLGARYALSHHKRWIYSAIARDDIYVGVAIVDLTYAANAFAVVSDPRTGVIAHTSHMGLPGLSVRVGDRPEEGCDAQFQAPGAHFAFNRRYGSSTYDLTVVTRDVKVYATFDTRPAPAPVVAVARPLGGDVNVTEKRVLMAVRGMVETDGRKVDVDGALGGIDYTQGFLPRATAWRWAYLMGKTTDGRRVGMNLVEGFNGQPECALWLEGETFSVGEGRFSFSRKAPLSPWKITTTCGAVDVTFDPVGMHSEDRDLVLLRSTFVQPVGTFRGTLRIPGHGKVSVDGAPGVVEDQNVRW
jgi:hypothetical protein